MQVLELFRTNYQEARRVQEEKIEQLLNGRGEEVIILTEHQPILTLGFREENADLGISPQQWEKLGVEIIKTDRGGAATYHGPGQIVVYPVISLKKRNWGVRKYINEGLGGIVDVLNEFGLLSRIDFAFPGVWTEKTNKKVAQVGIRMIKGLTNHGFSINVNCDLQIFKYFKPCNLSADLVSSIKAELENFNTDVYEVGRLIANKMRERF